MKQKLKTLWKVFAAFFRIGAFTFGGGYAMIPLIQHETVEKQGWVSDDDILEIIAIAESTPGPIAINAATYIGYQMLGFLGSLTATVAVCIPSFVIIYAVSLFFDAFLSLTLVAYAFKGIQVCVIWLILSAGLKMLKQMKKTAFNISILSAVLLCMVACSVFSVNFSTIFYILIAGGIGLFVYALGLLRGKKEADK